jgi:hypothetical protein
MTLAVDARTLNWRFVVPDEPQGLLLLAVQGEHVASAVVVQPGSTALEGALGDGPYPAVVAPDLGDWAARGRPGWAGRLLVRLCGAVAPGGWLCVGFANAWYPGAPARPGSLGLRTAVRTLGRAGLSEVEVYLALPSQRRPAFLVPAARPAELGHVLDRLFFTYVPAEQPWAMARRELLAALRRGAARTPHGIRTRLAPAYCVVARRPA